MNAQAISASKMIFLPKRVFHADWDIVERKLAVTRTGAVDPFNISYEVAVPADWTIGASDVSPWQLRLIDGNGKHLAKVFFKPLGAAGALELMILI